MKTKNMKTKRFSQFLREMAEITKKGKKILADGNPLRSTDLATLDKNIIIYMQKENSFFWPVGKFFLWMCDNEDYAGKLMSGEFDMLTFPIRTRWNAFETSPINDIWKASHLKKYKGSQQVIGMVEGQMKGDKLWIEMMSVRPTHRRNNVNTIMLNALKRDFPDKKIAYVDPTEDGYAYIIKNDPDAEIEWTTSWRPKAFRESQKNPLE